jgi:hypothetical protein
MTERTEVIIWRSGVDVRAERRHDRTSRSEVRS